MKMNKKGFTLVELLGTIVIMGILLVLGLPTIVGMIDSNRKKIYVTDAQKLITKAEYKIKANASEIEKPDPGNCIVISLTYLDDETFDNPPYEGEYERDVSFVVAKNTGNGNMEYSAMIVEHTKDGYYQGIELTRETALKSNNAVNHVVTFKKEDLDDIRIKDEGNSLDETQINRMLKKTSNMSDNYVEYVDNYYNYPKTSNSDEEKEAFKPVIEKTNLYSTSEKNFNSLDVTLTVSVKDEDTPKSMLKVYIAIGQYNDDKDGFAEALNHVYNYQASDRSFSKNFDLSVEEDNHQKYSYNGEKIKFYVVVKDELGNEDKKAIDYIIYKNEAPTIMDGSGFYSETINNINAILRLLVKDDIDETGSLQICYTEDKNATECNNYQAYSSVINSQSQMDYTFQCPETNGCSLDGSTHYLNVFIKDSENMTISRVFDYTLYSNKGPTLQALDYSDNPEYISITSNADDFPSEGAFKTVVEIHPKDDMTNTNQIKVTLNEIKNGVVVKSSGPTNYSGNLLEFTFEGTTSDYDGKPRTLQVVLEDSEGMQNDLSDPIYTKEYTVYANKAPAFSNVEIKSSGPACSNTSLCPEELGGRNVIKMVADVEDDIDQNNNIKFCISEEENGCSDQSKFTISYSMVKENSTTPYEYTLNHDYSPTSDGSNHYVPIYVAAMDSLGVFSAPTKIDYLLYQNQAPMIIEEPTLINEDKIVGISNTYIDDEGNEQQLDEEITLDQAVGKFKYHFVVQDDLDSDNHLRVKVCYRKKGTSDNTCLPETSYSASSDHVDYFEKSIDLGLNSYTGQIYEVYATVTDEYNQTLTTSPVEYVVYNDLKPEVINASGAISEEHFSEHTMQVSFTVADPFDTYQICVSDVDDPTTCTNYVGNGENGDFDGTQYQNYVIDYTGTWTLNNIEDYNAGDPPSSYDTPGDSGENNSEEDDDNQSGITPFYLFVKDSNGHISDSSKFRFKNYHVCSELNESVTREDYYIYTKMDEDGNNLIQYTYNGTPITDNTEISPKYCEGNCYYWDSISSELATKLGLDSTGPSITNGKFGYYSRRITYQDKYLTDKFCRKEGIGNEASDTIEGIRLACNYYKGCLYNPITVEDGVDENGKPRMKVDENQKDPYKNKAIGLVIRTSDVPITGTYELPIYETQNGEEVQVGIDTKTYTCTQYYQGYETEYNNATQEFNLNKTDYKYCVDLVANGIYPFNEKIVDTYFRVLDDE